MYVRIKRAKTTVFLHCDPIDTILQLKERIDQVLNIPVDHQRLFRGLEEDEELQNSTTLEELQLEKAHLGPILCLTCFDDDQQVWESINIPNPATEEVEEAEDEE